MPAMPVPRRTDSSDRQALAQVEKWMALIRELSHERPAPTIIPPDNLSAKE